MADADDDEVSDGDKAIIVALSLVRKAIVDLPLALAVTAMRYGHEDRAPAPAHPAGLAPATSATPVFDRPVPVIVVGPVPLPVTGMPGDQRNAKSASGAAKDDGVSVRLGTMLAAKFAVVLAPLALLGAVLTSSAAGFQTLALAVQVLAATLAPILLPVVVALAAAMIELSDEFAESLQPAIKSFTRFILSTVLPVMQFLVKVLGTLADVVGFLITGITGAVGALGSFVKGLFAGPGVMGALAEKLDRAKAVEDAKTKLTDEEKRAVMVKFKEDVKAHPVAPGDLLPKFEDALVRAAREKAGGGVPGGMGKREAIDDVLTSLRMSMLPKAQFTGLAQVGQAQQLAALNGDPLQLRLLNAMLRAADGIEGVRADLRREAAPPAPAHEVRR